MPLKYTKMTANKYYRRHNKKIVYLSLIFIAQTCTIQFFPLYLKHLNLSAIEVGIIRASQTWISVFLLPLWFSLAKQAKSTRWKKFVISVFLTLTTIIYLCLLFIPDSNKTQNITHCHLSSSFPSRKSMVSSFDDENINYILPNELSSNSHLDRKLNHTKSTKIVSNELDTNVENKSNLSSPISKENSKANRITIYQDSFRDTSAYNSTGEIQISPNGINTVETSVSASKEPMIMNRPNFRYPTENYPNIRQNETVSDENIYSSKQSPINKSNNNNTITTTTSDFQYSSPGHIFFSKTEQFPELNRTNNSNIHKKQNLIPRIHGSMLKDEYNITNIFKESIPNNLYYVLTSASPYDSNNNGSDTVAKLFPKSFLKQRIGDNISTVDSTIKEYSVLNHYSLLPIHENKLSKGRPVGTNLWKIEENQEEQYSSHFEEEYSPDENKPSASSTSHHTSHHKHSISQPRRGHNITKHNFKDTLNRNSYLFHSSNIENQSSESQMFITHNDWEKKFKHRYQRSLKNKRYHRVKRHHRFEFHHKFRHRSKWNNEDNNEGLNSSHRHPMPSRLYQGRHKTVKNHKIIRRLMSLEQPQFQTKDFNTDSEVQKIHLNHWLNKEKLASELGKFFVKKKIEHIFSMMFGVMLFMSILCEVFSRAAEIASNLILNRDETATSIGFKYYVNIKADSQQIWKLIIWGILGCPLLALLVVMTNCSYQPRIYLLLPCLITITAVLTVWFYLKLPDSAWEWKLKDYDEELTQQHITCLAKFGYCISTLVAGFAMACNLEFILWYMDTLDNFTYNYQMLYCGYIATGAVFQAVTKSWLLKKQMKVPAVSQDCINSDVDIARGDGLWSIGPILLGLHFLAASLLQPAWSLLPLGSLQGMSAAFLVSVKISGWWAAGYGFGSLFGGFMVELYSADWLFWIMAGTMFVWSAVITLCGGFLKFIGYNDRGRASYSQLLLPEGDSDNEEVLVEEEVKKEQEEECDDNDDDWLEKALKKDEQLESQRRRIMSCPT